MSRLFHTHQFVIDNLLGEESVKIKFGVGGKLYNMLLRRVPPENCSLAKLWTLNCLDWEPDSMGFITRFNGIMYITNLFDALVATFSTALIRTWQGMETETLPSIRLENWLCSRGKSVDWTRFYSQVKLNPYLTEEQKAQLLYAVPQYADEIMGKIKELRLPFEDHPAPAHLSRINTEPRVEKPGKFATGYASFTSPYRNTKP